MRLTTYSPFSTRLYRIAVYGERYSSLDSNQVLRLELRLHGIYHVESEHADGITGLSAFVSVLA